MFRVPSLGTFLYVPECSSPPATRGHSIWRKRQHILLFHVLYNGSFLCLSQKPGRVPHPTCPTCSRVEWRPVTPWLPGAYIGTWPAGAPDSTQVRMHSPSFPLEHGWEGFCTLSRLTRLERKRLWRRFSHFIPVSPERQDLFSEYSHITTTI